LAASLLISASLLAGIGAPFVLANSPAGADPIATLQQRAQYIASEVQGAQIKLTILDETYNQAQIRVASLDQQLTGTNKAIGRTEEALGRDRTHLREVAIEDYVTGGESQTLSVLFSGNQQTAGMQQVYIQAAAGNLNESETTVLITQRSLSIERAKLNHTAQLAKANETTISNDLAQAKALTTRLNNEEANVKGQLAAAVAAAQQANAAAYQAALAKAAEQAAAQQANAAAYQAALAKAAQQAAAQQATGAAYPAASAKAAQQAAAQQASKAAYQAALAKGAQQAASQQPPPSSGTTTPVAGDNAGQIAVRAAQGQRGVPYVWGGATPGMGFDCSGLTMWAWAQAGVSLAHGATEQYYEVQHVSMSDLEPGDLIFYGNASLLYHVVMYIGNGMVVQAEETGTNVMDTPIPPGAYGAGMP
jgi:cell wall-associated NlpC family hydrolase